MSAQAAQVPASNGIFPAHAIQNGRLSKNFIYMIRAPQWSTPIGKPDNEYKRRRRHRHRL